MDGLKDCKECIGQNLLLMQKVDVNGENAHPLYKFLRLNSPLFDEESQTLKPIPWNYCKFLIDKDGKVTKFFKSGDTKDIEIAVESLLSKL